MGGFERTPACERTSRPGGLPPPVYLDVKRKRRFTGALGDLSSLPLINHRDPPHAVFFFLLPFMWERSLFFFFPLSPS